MVFLFSFTSFFSLIRLLFSQKGLSKVFKFLHQTPQSSPKQSVNPLPPALCNIWADNRWISKGGPKFGKPNLTNTCKRQTEDLYKYCFKFMFP